MLFDGSIHQDKRGECIPCIQFVHIKGKPCKSILTHGTHGGVLYCMSLTLLPNGNLQCMLKAVFSLRGGHVVFIEGAEDFA